MKRLLSLVLAIAIVLSAGAAMAEIQRVTDEKVEVTFWAAYNPTYQLDWEKMKCWEYFEEATGVHINWVLFANSGEMKEKLQVLLASGQIDSLPDAFYRCSVSDSQLKKYGPEGLFIDVKDLVKQYAPNLCARLDEVGGWGTVLDPQTGAMYGMPSINAGLSTNINPKIFLNTKMMANLGVTEMPTTLDELVTLLKLVRDEDANGNGDKDDEVCLVTNNKDRYFFPFTGAFGVMNRGRTTPQADADPADPTKVRFVYTADGYRELLKFMTMLYKENLIDQNMFAPSTAKMVAMGSQDMIFGLLYTNISAASVPDESVFKALPTSLTGPTGENAFNVRTQGIGNGGFVITANCKNPELLVKWIDNMYSDEGSLLLYFGKEGVDYYLNEQGEPTFMPEMLAKVSAEEPYDKVLSSVTPYASGGLPSYYSDVQYCGAEARGEPVVFANNVKDLLPETVWSFNFTTEENEEVSALEADILKNCHDVYRAKFVTGELDINDDAVWQAYVQEVEKLGLEDLLYYYQIAVDRAAAAAAK